jgi:3-dehydroquinate synthase
MSDFDDTNPTQVRVELGARSYDILIGTALLDGLGAEIVARYGTVRAGIVSDSSVAPLYRARIEASLKQAGIEPVFFEVAAGEASKCLSVFETLVEDVVGARLERGDVLIALGGGVVGDLTGYVAASVRRGIGFVQVPTSLLAQVDSSVGGKTGINSAHGKNLIGAFYQPGLVLADTDTLNTLSPRELRAGYAEVAKYGLIDDPAFFAWLEQNHEAILVEGDASARIHAIAHSCRAKARIVSEDEQEHGKRALLNLGHTFGHALEGATGYSDRLVHGEGVAIGMVLAHQFSAYMNLCSPDDGARVQAHLQAAGLPTSVADIEGDALDTPTLLRFIGQDKKVQRGALTFILTRSIGEAFVSNDVPPSAVEDFLRQTLKA